MSWNAAFNLCLKGNSFPIRDSASGIAENPVVRRRLDPLTSVRLVIQPARVKFGAKLSNISGAWPAVVWMGLRGSDVLGMADRSAAMGGQVAPAGPEAG